MDVLVICPSRGRPKAARKMWELMRATAVMPTTRLLVAVDADDPRAKAYLGLMGRRGRFGMDVDDPIVRVLQPEDTGDMVRAMNSAVRPFVDRELIIGMVNDDQRFRTPGWDRIVAETLVEPGIAYGNDLFQGQALVTCPFISARIVRILGWYCLPVCRHLFVDNAWLDLGEGIERLAYLPDVVVEHLHPFAGKARWDAGYERANSDETIEHDRTAYEAWRDGEGRREDVWRVRSGLYFAKADKGRIE